MCLAVALGGSGLATHRPATPATAGGPAGSTDKSTGYKVKSAWLFNFAKYTSWPKGSFSSDSDPIRIVIVGKDPFGKILDEVLGGKSIGKRPIVVERVPDPTKLGKAHMVFVGEMGRRDREALLNELSKRAVLTVSERTSFTKEGGVCRFYSEKGKLRFEVNVDASGRAKLDLSSQLLKLAKIVRDRP